MPHSELGASQRPRKARRKRFTYDVFLSHNATALFRDPTKSALCHAADCAGGLPQRPEGAARAVGTARSPVGEEGGTKRLFEFPSHECASPQFAWKRTEPGPRYGSPTGRR